MNHYLIAAGVFTGLAAAGGIAYAATKARSNRGFEVTVPEPTVPRTTPIYCGYYETRGDQLAETRDHVNMIWTGLGEGVQRVIENLRSAQMVTLLDVDPCIWMGVKGSRNVRPDADAELRARFDTLRAGDVLHLIKTIVVKDEPNQPGDNYADFLPQAAALVRRVAADYAELNGLLLGCMYAGNKPMPHIELFDLVGFDNYERRSGVLAPGGEYDQMAARLLPGQRTMLMIGGYETYRQDPTEFVKFALAHPEVLLVGFFLWPDYVNGEPFKGIGSDPQMRALYVAAGKRICAVNPGLIA